MMASKIEYDEWARGDHDQYPYNTEFGNGKPKEEMEKIDKDNQEKIKQSKAANKAFKELFGN
jgi:hypothetical protein